ncbi:speckle-type POZ protein homolog [Paramacrobiotus metropolitanus]|uniref:speckle-type POZ protein homolog n=1 Tax=Paramacrobiotus metropolitanus TaxID=2943436 RepID=UPI00244580AB|nr:speckle-type POZ protein homolog [Paramacrobiotus metropolitanus]
MIVAVMHSKSNIVVRESTAHQQITFTLQWTIEGFLLHLYDTGTMFNAGITMVELGMNHSQGRWRIGLQPCHVDPEHPGMDGFSLAAYLYLTDTDLESKSFTGQQTFLAGCRISLATGRSMVQIVPPTELLTIRFGSADSSYGAGKLISHRDLTSQLLDDCITVTMDVSLETGAETFHILNREPDQAIYRQQFCNRLADMFSAETNLQSADFTICSSEGQSFSVHRLLLMAFSPVFSAMLTHDSMERQHALCQLDDIDGETVTIFLDYLYGCNMAKVNPDNAEKVLIMADKYAVTDLRSFCELMLSKNLNVENAAKYLACAEQRQLCLLKENAQYLLNTDRTPHSLRPEGRVGNNHSTEETKQTTVPQKPPGEPTKPRNFMLSLVVLLAIVVACLLFGFAFARLLEGITL